MSRQTGRSEAKRQAVIAAATRVFLAEGYARASMDGIAAEAEVSKRTVYNHFPAKRDLFRAVVAELYAALLMPGADLLAPDSDPEQALPRFAARVLEHLRRPEVVALLRLVIAEQHRVPELAQDFFAGGKGPALGMLGDYLREQAKRGTLSLAAPERAAAEYLGAIKEGCFWPGLLGLPTAPEAEAIASATTAFLKAYATSP